MPKRYLTGGGKPLKKLTKSYNYFYKTLKSAKYLIEKFIRKTADLYAKLTFVAYDRIGEEGPRAQMAASNRRNQDLRATLHRGDRSNRCDFIQKFALLISRHEDKLLNSRGSVLIEFAVCMPVLIILMFYINDLVRMKRYYSQTEFVAQQIANMIQNVSQNRSSKRITKNDLGNVHILAWQTVCYGVSQFRINSIFPLHYKPITSIYLVKGENNGTASCVWRIWLSFFEKSSIRWTTATQDNSHSIIRFKKNVSPSEIYSELKINPGEQKIIVETLVERENVAAYGSVSDSAAMGMHFLSPAKVKDGTWSYFFPSAIIFTPKPGLFDETIPS